jgi:carbon storage regulator CsrA
MELIMLILGRKEGEKIHLGNDIIIQIVEINKGVIKLGIDAPKDVIVLRGELIDRIQSSNKQANQEIQTREIKDLSKLLKK